MGKDDKCCVPFCGNRRKLKRSLSYFRIPQNPQQRTAWLEILKKDPGTIAANDRVCSVHFVSGKPSPFSQNVDWMPTLCMDRKEGDDQETREQPMNNAKKKVEKVKMKMPTSSMYVSSNTESQQSLNKSFEDPSKMDVTLQQHASHHHHHHHPFQQPQQQAPQAYHQQHFPPHLHHARAHQQYPAHYQSLFQPQSHYQQPPLTHHQLIPHQHHPHLHLQAHHHHHQQQQLPPPPQQPPPPPRQPVPSQQQPPPLQQPPPSHQQPPPPSHQQPPPPSHQQPPPSHQQPPPSQQPLSSLQHSPSSQQPAASQQSSLLPPTLQQLSPSQQPLQQQTQQHMHHSLLHHQQQNQQLHQQHPQQQHTPPQQQQQPQHPQLQQQQHTQSQPQSQHMPTQQESQITQQHSQQMQQQPLMQQQQPQQLTQQQKSQQHADQQQHSQQHMQQSQQQQQTQQHTQQHAQQQPQQHMQQMQSQHLQQHSQSHTSQQQHNQQQTQQHLQQQHTQTPQQQSQQQQSQAQHSQQQQSQPQHSQQQQSQPQHSQQQQSQPQHSQQQSQQQHSQQQQSQPQHSQQQHSQQQSQQQHLQQQQSQQQHSQQQQQHSQQQQSQQQHSQQHSQQQQQQPQQQQLAQHSQQQQKPPPQQHHSTVQQHSHQDHHQPQTLPQQQPLQQNVCVLCNEKFPTKEALQQHFRTHANSGVRYSRTINHSQSVQSASHPPLLSPPSPVGSQSGSSQAPSLSPVFSSSTNRNHNAVSSNPQSSITNSASTPGLTEKWTCAVCSRIFTTKSSYLTHHMRYHPQETGHHCPHCGRMFPLRADWERHLQTHPNSGPFTPIPCTVCRADFFNQEALHYHMQNHRKVEKITGQTGPDGDLNDVVRPSKRLRIDGMGEPQACYYCPWCGKEYIQRYNLEAHIRKLHKGWTKAERLFHCDMCDSDFYNQSALMQHNFSHQENHGYLINPADMCKVELEEETNLLNQLSQLPLVPSDQSSSSSGDSKQPWPEWMNALPPELLRAIKQEPPSPPPTANNDAFTESGMFPCLECGGQFPTQVVLKQHRCLPGRENPMIKRESRADLTCGVCGCSFKSESELADHLLKLHEVYLCSQCGEELPNRTAYLDHQKWHAGNANNGEEVRIPLNVFLSEKEKMERKMAAAATDNRLKEQDKKNEEKMTESDKKDQANKEQDEKHKKTKNKDDEQFVCGLCDQHFPDQSSLECHFREMGDHVSKNARFSVTCNVCGLSFTLEAFKKHSHSNRASDISSGKSGSGPPNGSIPIKCGICQEDFATKEEIDAHFASHPETERDMSRRSFLCNVCVAEDPALALIASFSTLRELYDHHARQHPQMSSNYQCRLCGMRFFQQWDLASHFAKHLPENIRNQCQVVFKNGQLKATFVCERCDQVFNYEVHLANHLRNNTCLKWACTICGKGHRSAKHRNQHIREAHRDDSLRYVCKVDGCMGRSVFSKRAHVHAHIRSKHPQVLRCGPNGTVEGTPDELDRFVLVESADACDNSTETEKSSGYCAKEENNKLSVDAKQEKSA